MDRDELLRLFRAFEAEALDYVLIGATAMGLHGIARAARWTIGTRLCSRTRRANRPGSPAPGAEA